MQGKACDRKEPSYDTWERQRIEKTLLNSDEYKWVFKWIASKGNQHNKGINCINKEIHDSLCAIYLSEYPSKVETTSFRPRQIKDLNFQTYIPSENQNKEGNNIK